MVVLRQIVDKLYYLINVTLSIAVLMASILSESSLGSSKSINAKSLELKAFMVDFVRNLLYFLTLCIFSYFGPHFIFLQIKRFHRQQCDLQGLRNCSKELDIATFEEPRVGFSLKSPAPPRAGIT